MSRGGEFNKQIEGLWKRKRTAYKQYQRNKKDEGLKEAAKQASSTFEKAASAEKERIYAEFSGTITEGRTLHKFWQLHEP